MTYVSIIPSVLIGSNYNSVRKNRPFSLIYQYGLNEYFIAQIILDLVTGSCVLVTYTPTVFILFLLSVTTRYSGLILYFSSSIKEPTISPRNSVSFFCRNSV